MRFVTLISVLIAAFGIGIGVYYIAFSSFSTAELAKARARLSLYHSTVVAELERFSHLTYVLARDPFVIDTALGADRNALNHRLQEFTEQAGLEAIYLIDHAGDTIAASNAGSELSFVGQNYAFRPYFQDAMKNSQGRFYGIGTTTGRPGYFIADQVQTGTTDRLAVITLKIDLSALQDSWRASGEDVLLVNGDGVVLLSADPNWRYRSLSPLTDMQRQRIADARQFTNQPLTTLNWSKPSQNRALIDGQDALHVTATDLPHGWKLHYFTSDDRAVTQALLVAGSVFLLAASALILWQLRRARHMRQALQQSALEEALLRQTNSRLAREIEDRRTAERRLKRTQGELERAGRLAALGQLAASVTHELGQPIAAMRNHLMAAQISKSPPETLTERMNSLVERMEGITRQLKFFARSDDERFETFDLCAALQAALDLIDSNLQAGNVELHTSMPDFPVLVRGNRLRLEQVMINILRNAIDAMDDLDNRQLDVEIDQNDHSIWFEVRDTGHGLGDATLADLREPFITTRESGRGMGLGLAISASIVKDHGAEMHAQNRPEGGALFRVTLPCPEAQEGSHP